MENAALPLLNLAILGAFLVLGLRELGSLTAQAIEIRDDRNAID